MINVIVCNLDVCFCSINLWVSGIYFDFILVFLIFINDEKVVVIVFFIYD